MILETVDISDISQDPANVRKHSERNLESIAASLRAFGQQKPIVVDKRGVILAGNGTYEAAKRIGWDKIKITRTDLSGTLATAYAIADNRTAELAEWDDTALAEQLRSLQSEEFDLANVGYTDDEVQQLIDGIGNEILGASEVTEDEIPEPPIEPITKPGDLWLLGEHRLLCGDSTKTEDVQRLMNGEKADLCFTSPPYNAGNAKTGAYSSGSANRKDFKRMYHHELDAMSSGQYKDFLLCVLDNISNVLQENGVVGWNVCYNANSRREYGEVVFSERNPLPVQETVIWDKTLGMNVSGNNIYSRTAEFVFLLSKNDKYKSNQNGGVYWNIWRISNRDGESMNHGHGASFPVALPVNAIKQHSLDGETVYEPFCGSGTTLIAAEQLGRKCYGMEISPQYCDVIVKRWETLTGRVATRA